MSFLSTRIATELRETVLHNQFLADEIDYHSFINLLYAIMDRIDSCVEYLNNHDKHPETEMDFLSFIMTSCIIIDAVPIFFQLAEKSSLKTEIRIKSDENSKGFFQATCEKNKNKNVRGPFPNECPTDDKFFEYIRSLIFAHPFETSRSHVIPQNTTQYSPFILVDTTLIPSHNDKDEIGIRIYSDDKEQEKIIYISFKSIKAYIKHKYNHLSMIKDWINEQVAIVHNRWKQRKVRRNIPVEDILLDIKEICKERNIEYIGDIEELYNFFVYPITDIMENRKNIIIYRNAIRDLVPLICDAVDAIDTETLYTLPNKVLFPSKIQNTSLNFDYWVGIIRKGNDSLFEASAKIFVQETESWGWFKLDLEKMDPEEIRLLVSATCYLQKQRDQTTQKRGERCAII